MKERVLGKKNADGGRRTQSGIAEDMKERRLPKKVLEGGKNEDEGGGVERRGGD